MVPPFAEEMMKARSQFTQLALACGAKGVTSRIVDVRGTGDAEGELADATWDDWCNDVSIAYKSLLDEGFARIHVVGLRLGALLALDACARHQLQPLGIVAWEPQLAGKQAMRQFMRIAQVGAKLQAKTAVEPAHADGAEVGGYWISKALEASINAATPPSLLPSRRALLVRIAGDLSDADATPSPTWQSVIAAWRDTGATVDYAAVQSPAFWTTTEITTCAALTARTLAWIAP
jgi:uncharacterized protein